MADRSTATWALACAALSFACCSIGCAPDDAMATASSEAAAPWFRERAVEAGLAFEHRSGADGRFLFPEIVTGGVCLCDVDADDDLDVYLVQGGALDGTSTDPLGNRLFLNDGVGNFVDATERAGVGDTGYGMGCACGDVDLDGDDDLFVTNVGPDVLYQNDGTGRFVDVTARARLGDDGWGTSAAFFDFDADGDLDLFVARYVRWSLESNKNCLGASQTLEYCSPLSVAAPAIDLLYENLGDGTFRDVTSSAQMDFAFGNGLGVVTADFDVDGGIDVYVANDGVANQLWRNLGEGRFEDHALLGGAAVNARGTAEAGMGVVAVDLENDGDADLVLTHLQGETNTCYVNREGFFRDRTAATGLAGHSVEPTGFGIGAADFDHDGHLDLYVANGKVKRGDGSGTGDPYAEPNQAFRGVGAGRFEEVEPRGGTSEPLVRTSRAAAFGDLDGDGDVDVVVVERDAHVTLLENVAARPGAWVRFRVLDARGHEAQGAMVRLEAGERTQWRVVGRSYSFQASNDPHVHFGLGEAGTIDAAVVRWLDGSEEAFRDIAPARTYTLRRGRGLAVDQ